MQDSIIYLKLSVYNYCMMIGNNIFYKLNKKAQEFFNLKDLIKYVILFRGGRF